jgi:hypothetical protein
MSVNFIFSSSCGAVIKETSWIARPAIKISPLFGIDPRHPLIFLCALLRQNSAVDIGSPNGICALLSDAIVMSFRTTRS